MEGGKWKVSRPCYGGRRRRQACKGQRAQVTNAACHMVKQERFTTDPVSHWPHGVAASECQAWAVRSDSGFRTYTQSGRLSHDDWLKMSMLLVVGVANTVTFLWRAIDLNASRSGLRYETLAIKHKQWHRYWWGLRSSMQGINILNGCVGMRIYIILHILKQD